MSRSAVVRQAAHGEEHSAAPAVKRFTSAPGIRTESLQNEYREVLRATPKAALGLAGNDVAIRASMPAAQCVTADHATITLPFWHRVIMNTETQSRTMANVAFLD